LGGKTFATRLSASIVKRKEADKAEKELGKISKGEG